MRGSSLPRGETGEEPRIRHLLKVSAEDPAKRKLHDAGGERDRRSGGKRNVLLPSAPGFFRKKQETGERGGRKRWSPQKKKNGVLDIAVPLPGGAGKKRIEQPHGRLNPHSI